MRGITFAGLQKEITMKFRVSKSHLAGLALALWLTPLAVMADSGFYVGGSVGAATIEASLGDTGIPELPSSIDEDDTAFKAFVGYNFDLPVVDLGIEAGYVNFGAPEIGTLVGDVEVETTGINVWGIAGVDAGPIDLFAKLGYVSWDVEASLQGVSASEDGTDMGYGVGLGFGLGGVKIRGEYEMYDLDDADMSMLSVGVVFQFN